jgi:TonB family protein
MVSALGHVIAFCVIAIGILWGGLTSQKVYVVNLVPMVAAVGSPTGVSHPALPPRAPVQTPSRTTLPEPSPREARAPEPLKLPDSAPPLPRPAPRTAALPRPGEKELPPLATPSETRPAPTLPAATKPAETPREARPAPPAPAGQVTGSSAGVGTLTIDVSDFPHAWYLRQVLQKVEDRWQRQGQPAEPPQKPFVLVEIQRDGSIRSPRIERSSGNAFYDQAALRAIADASPFPPLPQDWNKPSLRVMFRFDLRAERG